MKGLVLFKQRRSGLDIYLFLTNLDDCGSSSIFVETWPGNKPFWSKNRRSTLNLSGGMNAVIHWIGYFKSCFTETVQHMWRLVWGGCTHPQNLKSLDWALNWGQSHTQSKWPVSLQGFSEWGRQVDHTFQKGEGMGSLQWPRSSSWVKLVVTSSWWLWPTTSPRVTIKNVCKHGQMSP